MCIGWPMQVQQVEPGHAVCERRGTVRRVRTTLVGPVAPGDWLLVFLDDARERVDPQRAAEVDAALQLLEQVGLDPQHPPHLPSADPGFDLPSRWSPEQLKALTGGDA